MRCPSWLLSFFVCVVKCFFINTLACYRSRSAPQLHTKGTYRQIFQWKIVWTYLSISTGKIKFGKILSLYRTSIVRWYCCEAYTDNEFRTSSQCPGSMFVFMLSRIYFVSFWILLYTHFLHVKRRALCLKLLFVVRLLVYILWLPLVCIACAWYHFMWLFSVCRHQKQLCRTIHYEKRVDGMYGKSSKEKISTKRWKTNEICFRKIVYVHWIRLCMELSSSLFLSLLAIEANKKVHIFTLSPPFTAHLSIAPFLVDGGAFGLCSFFTHRQAFFGFHHRLMCR